MHIEATVICKYLCGLWTGL